MTLKIWPLTHSFPNQKPLPLLLTLIPLSTVAADYSYDALNRLTQVRYEKGQVLNYHYDAAGNRLSVTEGRSTQAQCLLYAVHDQGISDSPFLTIDPANDNPVELLGPIYAGYNLESLDVHPLTNERYAASTTGQLYQLNGFSGELQLLGTTGYSKINGLSFAPVGQLWDWVNNTGLIPIALPS